jgi:hypothetical protein
VGETSISTIVGPRPEGHCSPESEAPPASPTSPDDDVDDDDDDDDDDDELDAPPSPGPPSGESPNGEAAIVSPHATSSGGITTNNKDRVKRERVTTVVSQSL